MLILFRSLLPSVNLPFFSAECRLPFESFNIPSAFLIKMPALLAYCVLQYSFQIYLSKYWQSFPDRILQYSFHFSYRNTSSLSPIESFNIPSIIAFVCSPACSNRLSTSAFVETSSFAADIVSITSVFSTRLNNAQCSS